MMITPFRPKLKAVMVIGFMLMTSSISVAQKYVDKVGSVSFFSSAPLEDIKAESKQLTSIIDASTQELVALVMMTTFEFDKSLMQEHFNENYIESDKYPKATFRGKLKDFDKLSKTLGQKQQVSVKGEMTMHGVTKPFETTAEITWIDDKSFKAKAVFKIKLEDYKIEIPTLVFQNIAEVVEVTLALNYKLQ